jgi:hypothetical protein
MLSKPDARPLFIEREEGTSRGLACCELVASATTTIHGARQSGERSTDSAHASRSRWEERAAGGAGLQEAVQTRSKRDEQFTAPPRYCYDGHASNPGHRRPTSCLYGTQRPPTHRSQAGCGPVDDLN